jgi:hypothetical protein
MNLAILLNDSYAIEEIAGKMDRIPYPCCEEKPLSLLATLQGISVLTRGGLKKVKERIPRNAGCTHVYEMIESTFRAIFVGSYRIVDQSWDGVLSLDLEEHRQMSLHMPVLADTCYAFHRASADEKMLKRALEKVEEAKRKRDREPFPPPAVPLWQGLYAPMADAARRSISWRCEVGDAAKPDFRYVGDRPVGNFPSPARFSRRISIPR